MPSLLSRGSIEESFLLVEQHAANHTVIENLEEALERTESELSWGHAAMYLPVWITMFFIFILFTRRLLLDARVCVRVCFITWSCCLCHCFVPAGSDTGQEEKKVERKAQAQ